MEEISEVVSDPIGVIIGLITDIEAGLDRCQVQAMVMGICGGRAKRRKLAQALAERLMTLCDFDQGRPLKVSRS